MNIKYTIIKVNMVVNATPIKLIFLQLPTSLVSTAPPQEQPTPGKMSKNKKKKLKKKAKRQNELLKRQMEQIIEIEEQKRMKENGDTNGEITPETNGNTTPSPESTESSNLPNGCVDTLAGGEILDDQECDAQPEPEAAMEGSVTGEAVTPMSEDDSNSLNNKNKVC